MNDPQLSCFSIMYRTIVHTTQKIIKENDLRDLNIKYE
jgi:hypothetical protein